MHTVEHPLRSLINKIDSNVDVSFLVDDGGNGLLKLKFVVVPLSTEELGEEGM